MLNISGFMKLNAKKIMGILLGAGLGLGLGYLIGSIYKTPAPLHAEFIPRFSKLTLLGVALPLFTLALFMVIFLHELGHVIAGVSNGFKFLFVITGPLRIYRSEGGIKMGINRNASLAGGIASCLPQNTNELKKRMLVMVAGGPLVSLLVFAGFYLVADFFNLFANLDRSHSLWQFSYSLFVVMCSYGSGLIFLATIVPQKASGMYSDGGRMLNLLKGGPKAEADMAITTLYVSSASGIRPRDLNQQMVNLLFNAKTDSLYLVYGYLYKYYAALDSGNSLEAAKWLGQLLEKKDSLLPAVLPIVNLEQTWFEAWVNKNLEKATASYENVQKTTMIEAHTFLRAEAALLLASGKYEAAIEKAERALALLPKSVDQGLAMAENEWLQMLLKEARAQKIVA
jgi:hypothetical protein